MIPESVPAPPPDPAPAREAVYSGPGWSLAPRVAFRLALVYLLLYIVPFPISALNTLVGDLREMATGEEQDPTKPSFIGRNVLTPYAQFWDKRVLEVGKSVFGVEILYRPAGSGDTTWNYVQIFIYAVASVAVTLVWSLAAWAWWRLRRRSRLGYPHLHAWLRVFVRFYLAQMMIVYGVIKVIKLQFGFPPFDTMLHSFGESSPMHLLWTFMGASDSYTWFTGAGELAGGLLLCTRRTALLGALVTFGVMIHVVALNFCYDVPVKLLSSHLVLMSVFLMAPDLPWLTRVFVFGRPETAPGYTPLVRRPWLDWTLFVVRCVIVIAFLTTKFHSALERSKMYGRAVPEPPLFGLWDVEEFSLDGKPRPPLTTDAARWSRMTFRKAATFRKSQPGKPGITITNMTEKPTLFGDVEVNEEAKTITITRPVGPPGSNTPPAAPPPAPVVLGTLRYTTPEPGVMEVEGEVNYVVDGKPGPKKVRAKLRLYGKDKFLLSGRGFHWINEVPYNRYSPRNEPPPPLPPPPKRP